MQIHQFRPRGKCINCAQQQGLTANGRRCAAPSRQMISPPRKRRLTRVPRLSLRKVPETPLKTGIRKSSLASNPCLSGSAAIAVELRALEALRAIDESVRNMVLRIAVLAMGDAAAASAVDSAKF